MHKYSAKSNIVLGLLSLLSLLALIAVENGKIMVKQQWYEEKLEASRLSHHAARHIKESRLEKGVFIDVVNDPNQTALIGQEYTMITTDKGYIEAKLSSVNPNFAAVVVQLMKDAGLEKGDLVAIAFSGSFPGINISVLSAIEVLDLSAIIITSVGASNYGANDPYFTWLDMEHELFSSNIFSHKSVAASTGGGFDVGRGLSPEGRELIRKAIERNKVKFIHEEHLEKSIARRMEIYQEKSHGEPVKAFINVGGGLASLGSTINGDIIEPGLTEFLPKRNYPVHGVIIQMGQLGVPIIHLLNLHELLSEYKLPESPIPMPKPGEGGIFVQKKYNMVVTAIASVILIGVILIVYFIERKHHRLGSDEIPDQQPKYDDENMQDNPVI